MPIHNKLVRDKIPQIIKNAGKKSVIKMLNEEEYIKELRKKSEEELQEYLSAKTKKEALEELADLLEVTHALANVHGSSMEDVENIRVDKEKKRGGFSDKVFLIEVEDD